MGRVVSPWAATPVGVLWLILVPAALLAGVYGRFKGIATWPLGVDEFYTSRSVDHVLATGLPRFLCGGFYTRGMLLQYLIAGLRWCGMSPEFAGRIIAAAFSLAVLPAAYALARRVQGRTAGWVVVIILAVSIWEIEMARFGRMYAPFQAVFSWYLVFYLRYTVDKDFGALLWMIALSVLGVLTWEGGALLGLANLFAVAQSHDRGRFHAADWRRLAGLLALLVLLYFATRDLRELGVSSVAHGHGAGKLSSRLESAAATLAALGHHPGWAWAFLLPLGVGAASLRWLWSMRQEWLKAGGLCVALAAAAAHQFTLTGAVLILMLLLRLLDWRELTARSARWFLFALLAFFIFWLGWAAMAHSSASAGASTGLVRFLFGFPDIYDEIVLPWGRAVPILFSELVLAVGYLLWRAVAAPPNRDDPTAVLLGLLVMMTLAVGVIPTDRIETRYTFYLYPLLIVLGVAAVAVLARRWSVGGYAAFLAVAPLLCFGATEDFQPRHLIEIDSAQTNFRIQMRKALAEHYYPRNDVRGIAQWLAANVRPGDVVIAGIPNLDQYYDAFDYFYFDAGDDRYDAYICPNGRTERWTGHPVLHGEQELESVVGTGRPAYVVVYPDVEPQILKQGVAADWQVTRAFTAADEQSHVLRIVPQSAARYDP